MKKPREQDTVAAILTLLRAHRIPAWRMNTGAFVAEHKGVRRFHRFGAKGMADILGVLRQSCTPPPAPTGRFLAIEVKQRGRKPTPEQQRFLDEVAMAGGLAFVAYSVADVQQMLGLGGA